MDKDVLHKLEGIEDKIDKLRLVVFDHKTEVAHMTGVLEQQSINFDKNLTRVEEHTKINRKCVKSNKKALNDHIIDEQRRTIGFVTAIALLFVSVILPIIVDKVF